MISFFKRMVVIIGVIVIIADSAEAWQISVNHANAVFITAWIIVATIAVMAFQLWYQMREYKLNKYY